jgi:hypothetical protein
MDAVAMGRCRVCYSGAVQPRNSCGPTREVSLISGRSEFPSPAIAAAAHDLAVVFIGGDLARRAQRLQGASPVVPQTHFLPALMSPDERKKQPIPEMIG